MANEQSNGITGVVVAHLPTWMIMVSFSAIALYNVIELTVIIFAIFKRREGLYFWSFVAATWGIAPHVVGFILLFFQIMPLWWPPVLLIAIGWMSMVTGQSLVLYSRLHLVSGSLDRIRWVLYMIIFNAICIGIPDMILAFLSNKPHPNLSVVNAFSIFDKVQVGTFFVQESIISGFYIYETVRMFGPFRGRNSDPHQKLLFHLILVNALVLILDATLLGTEYSGHWEIQTTYKPVIYAVKLKVEFSVLNRLVNIVKHKKLTGHSLSFGTNSTPLGFITGSIGSADHSNSVESSMTGDKGRRFTTRELSARNVNGGGTQE